MTGDFVEDGRRNSPRTRRGGQARESRVKKTWRAASAVEAAEEKRREERLTVHLHDHQKECPFEDAKKMMMIIT